MQRNYDEIISEMLIQIDRHAEELTKHSIELTKQSKRAEESHDRVMQELKYLKQTDSQLLTQIVHSAKILDRIIKKNKLRV